MSSDRVPRDVRGWAIVARDAGWLVQRVRGGHVEFRPLVGRRVLISTSPSDWRSRMNERARLRRAGLDV